MPVVHERIAPVAGGIPVRFIRVEDPYEGGAQIVVAQVLRDDPLGRLHARDQLRSIREREDDSKMGRDTGLARYEAAREMQTYYERAEIGNVKAMDTTKEPVDGGGIPDPFTDSKLKAMKKIAVIERVLGIEGSALLRDVLIRRMFLNQCALLRGITNDRGMRYLNRRFRETLELLAKELNYA